MKNLTITMTKRKLCKLLLGMVIGFSFLSCDDFLDREPLDQISQPKFWKTASQLDAYILGKYDWLPGHLSTWDMGYFSSDGMSDNMVKGLSHYGYMNGENNTTPTKEGDWKWGPIREINMFFDNYTLCEEPFEKYAHTYGEACFLKAYKYHELVMKFGDVPWYSHVIQDDDDEALQKKRDPRSLVVDSIMNLIDQAITNLKPRAEVGVNRLNKETALIYKSRVALYEGTWAKYHNGTPSASDVDAIACFAKAIEAYEQFKEMFGSFENHIYTADGPEKSYYNLFGKFNYSSVKEVTLSKSYSKALDVPNNVSTQVWYYGYSNFSYTLELVKSYLDKQGNSIDITDPKVIQTKGVAYLAELADALDPRFRQSVFVPGDLISSVSTAYKDSLFTIPQMHMTEAVRNTTTGFSPKKGHNPEASMDPHTDPMIDGISFRLAELILNYAEAYVELNNHFPDLSDNIDVLRKRVGMPTLTSVKPKVESWWDDYGYEISDELAIVRQERKVELAGEGYRTNDWKRWRAHKLFDGKRPKGFRFDQSDYDKINAVVRVPIDEGGYTDPYKVSLNNGVFNFKPDRDYLSPIPMEDLQLNRNLRQNPGWDTPK